MQIISEHPIPFFLLLAAFVACYLADFLLRRSSRAARGVFAALECFLGCCAILLILSYGGDTMLLLAAVLLMLLPLLL